MKKILGTCAFILLLSSGLQAATQPQRIGKVKSDLMVFTPASQVNVSTQVPISPTATYVQVVSTGGPVTFSATGSYPAISTSSAFSGQFLVLTSSSATNVVYISTGTNSAVVGMNSSIVISSSMSAVSFIYDGLQSVWKQIGKQQ